jgi:DNA-binding FadR family transcriptional regulator
MDRPAKMSEIVARSIVHDIVDRKLAPGTVLGSEKELLATYGVSRASLREALRYLEIQGFLATRSGPAGGPIVQVPTNEAMAKSMSLYFFVKGATLRELMDARVATESMMAGLAATHVKTGWTPTGEPSEAPALLSQSLAHQPGSYGPYHADQREDAIEFHRIVARLSYNRVLIASSEAMGELYNTRMAGLPVPKKLSSGIHAAHDQIASAILDGDADTASEAMAEHFRTYIAVWTKVCPWVMEEVVDWH